MRHAVESVGVLACVVRSTAIRSEAIFHDCFIPVPGFVSRFSRSVMAWNERIKHKIWHENRVDVL